MKGNEQQRVGGAGLWREAHVLPIDGARWEQRRAIVPAQAPLAVGAWLRSVQLHGLRVVSLSLTLPPSDGPWDGGRVIGLEGPGGCSYAVLPLPALLALEDLLTHDRPLVVQSVPVQGGPP